MMRRGQSCAYLGEKFFRQEQQEQQVHDFEVGLGVVSLRNWKNAVGEV